MNKTQVKLLIGIGVATAALAAITIGVIHELKAIRALTIDADDLPEEFANEEPLLEAEDEDEAPAAE